MTGRYTRYVNCMRCGRIETKAFNDALKYDLSCPECKDERQFGPGIYCGDYEGVTLTEAIKIRQDRLNAWKGKSK